MSNLLFLGLFLLSNMAFAQSFNPDVDLVFSEAVFSSARQSFSQNVDNSTPRPVYCGRVNLSFRAAPIGECDTPYDQMVISKVEGFSASAHELKMIANNRGYEELKKVADVNRVDVSTLQICSGQFRSFEECSFGCNQPNLKEAGGKCLTVCLQDNIQHMPGSTVHLVDRELMAWLDKLCEVNGTWTKTAGQCRGEGNQLYNPGQSWSEEDWVHCFKSTYTCSLNGTGAPRLSRIPHCTPD